MKTGIKRAASILLACLALSGTSAASLSVSALDSVTEKATQELSLSSDGSTITLQKGRTYIFPTITSRLIPGLSCRITTDSSRLLSLDGNTLTAKGVGKCTLTIILPSGKKIKKDINIIPPEVSVRFKTPTLTLGKGETAKLKSLLTSAGSNVKWTSSNKKVLSIDDQGKIKATGTGTSVVTASLENGKTASLKVTVKAAPKSIAFEKGSITVGAGEKATLNCSVNTGSAAYNITYTSSDPKTAEINKSSGLLTAHKTGKVVVTAKTANGKTTKCTVFVNKAPSSISLDKTSIVLKKGESTVLKVKLPDGSSSGGITFTPSNDKIIKVDSNGVVKALKTGTAYVLVKTYNGKTVYCNVKVVK